MLGRYLVKELKRAIEQDSFETLVATYYLSSSETHVPLSYFAEARWRIPDELFPLGTQESAKWLDFSKIPKKFAHPVKIAMLRYMQAREGNQKRRRGRSIVGLLDDIQPFLRFIEHLTDSLSELNPLIFANYVHYLKNFTGVKGNIIAAGVVRKRLMAVERLHELTQDLADNMSTPWPLSSSYKLSGGKSAHENSYVATSCIPDEILASLFQAAAAHLESNELLMKLRAYHHSNLSGQARHIAVVHSLGELKSEGFEGNLQDLRNAISLNLTACIVIILTTTGIRSNELLSLKTDCAFDTIEDGELVYWIRGEAEGVPKVWIASKITHKAIETAASITQVARDMLASELRSLERNETGDRMLSSARLHRNSIFLGMDRENIRTFNNGAVNYRLKIFAQSINLTWNLASHQFRPTFASYVVRSRNGDIRYLKEHLGHYSINTTVAYSKHGDHDASLLEDIGFAYSEYRQAKIEHMLLETTYLTGGLAEPIRKYRLQIKTYNNRAQMIKFIAEDVYLRGTSVGWCTNDKGGCVGGEGIEKTRCAKDGGCGHFLADDSNLPVWREIEAQQLELINLKDIGETGRLRAARDLKRCRDVIAQLDPEYKANEE